MYLPYLNIYSLLCLCTYPQTTFHSFENIKLLRWLSGKEPVCQCRRHKRCRFDPWVRKIPWRRVWQPTIVLLPGKSHERRRLAGYSPWVPKSQTRLKWLSTSCAREGATGDLHLIPDLEDPREEEMATHFNLPARIIPWTEEPGRLKFMGLQSVRHNLLTEQVWTTERLHLKIWHFIMEFFALMLIFYMHWCQELRVERDTEWCLWV